MSALESVWLVSNVAQDASLSGPRWPPAANPLFAQSEAVRKEQAEPHPSVLHQSAEEPVSACPTAILVT